MKKRFIALLSFTLLCSPYVFSNEISLEEIFTAKMVQSDEELAELNRGCKEFNLALEFNRSLETGEIETTLEVRGLKFPISQKLIEKIYYKLVKGYPYHNMTAQVRVIDATSDLIQEEQNFLDKRDIACHKAVEKLIGEKIEAQHTPRIALCCSGGGYRAMLSAAGIMCEFDNNGILDTTHYLAGLSGSTWTIAPWMLTQEPFHEFVEKLIDRAVTGFLHKAVSSHIEEIKSSFPIIAQYFIRKLIFKEIPSVVDIYGYCLALSLLDNKSKQSCLLTDLPAQINQIKDGNRPFPLYTAVIPDDEKIPNYAWFEFSPYEVASHELQGGVPSWSFGRKFVEGSSQTSAPPLTLGFLMGLWGSAMTVSFEEIYNIVLSKLEPKIIFAPLKLLTQETFVGDLRIFPAQLRNYNYKLNNQPSNTNKRNTVVDAGIDFGLPIPPLLNQNRDIDLIVICDASGDILGAPELIKAEQYARDNNFAFPIIDYTNITDQTFSVFDDGADSDAPIVIYIPMIKNDNYDSNFDPQDHLGIGGFMNTFNFKYSKTQATQLAGLFEYAAHEVKDTVIQQIKTLVQRKADK